MHLKSFLNVSFGCFSLVPCKKIFKGTSGQTICTHKQTQTHTTTHTPTHTHTHTHIYDVINDSSSAGCSREQSCANVYMYSLLLGILLRVDQYAALNRGKATTRRRLHNRGNDKRSASSKFL